MVHGGDIYRNNVKIDFSVNLNPMGTPEEVMEGVRGAMGHLHCYPDIRQTKARASIAGYEGVDIRNVYTGNGASELIMAVVRSVRPKKALLFEPGFYGYEHALAATDCEIVHYVLLGDRKNGASVDCENADQGHLYGNEDGTSNGVGINAFSESRNYNLSAEDVKALTEDIDLVFLCDPANPVGVNIEDSVLELLLEAAAQKGIVVCLDESFLLLSDKSVEKVNENGKAIDDGSDTFVSQKAVATRARSNFLLNRYDNLIIVSSLTKLFALPGIRMGYVLASEAYIGRIKAQLPEWNLSAPAEAAIVAGMKVIEETDYLTRSMELIRNEREFLMGELRKLGLWVYDSDTSFILFRGPMELYDRLLGLGILIRDCSSFMGLGRGFYRASVRCHEDNEKLISAMGDVINGI